MFQKVLFAASFQRAVVPYCGVHSLEPLLWDLHNPCAKGTLTLLQSNRMDTRDDFVEVYDDESGKKDKRTGKTQKLRRYKDDAYR